MKTLGNEVVKKNKGGRPTKYNEEMQRKAEAYYQQCLDSGLIPYIQRLAIELSIDTDTIVNTAKRVTKFSVVVKRIKNLQELKLLELTTDKSKGAAIGAMFQLKSRFGYVETERQLHAGANGEPLVLVENFLSTFKAKAPDNTPELPKKQDKPAAYN